MAVQVDTDTTERLVRNDADYLYGWNGLTNVRMQVSVLLGYEPASPGGWGSPAPSTIIEALDTIVGMVGTGLPPDADYGDIVITGGVWALDSSINFAGKTLNDGTIDGAAISNAFIDTTNSVGVFDTEFSISDSTTPTAVAKFDATNISSGTLRSFAFPDASGTLALTSGLTGGTVTATGGALTANAVVLGAGTTDTKVVAGIITDGTSVVTLGVAGGAVGGVDLKNATSGTLSVRPPTGALGTVTVTLPAATDTLVGKATTDTLTNKTLTSPKIGTAILDTNGNELFNLTATASAVNELTYANAATGNAPTFTASGGDTNISVNLVPKGSGTLQYNGVEVGYRQIPTSTHSAAYTVVKSDASTCLEHPASDANARTFTIDSVANQDWTKGTALTFKNETSQVLSIAVTTEALTLAGTTTSGTRSLAQNGIATAHLNDARTVWLISGPGLT